MENFQGPEIYTHRGTSKMGGGNEVGITAQGICDDCGVEYTAYGDPLRSEEPVVLPDRKEEHLSCPWDAFSE